MTAPSYFNLAVSIYIHTNRRSRIELQNKIYHFRGPVIERVDSTASEETPRDIPKSASFGVRSSPDNNTLRAAKSRCTTFCSFVCCFDLICEYERETTFSACRCEMPAAIPRAICNRCAALTNNSLNKNVYKSIHQH